MNRTGWSFLASALGMVCLAAPLQAAEAAARKPNVLVIVADDLGYGELGCYGGRDVPTPHIDSLAKNGVRCTNGYVSCPVCSPTRAGLLTGRYQQRFGHEFNPGPAEQAADNFGLPLTEVTLADRLKKAGYVTAIVGKWHLGYKPAYQPQRRGFDEFYGFLAGAHPYLSDKAKKRRTILRGTEPVAETEYLTDAFHREAVAFIDRHAKDPFFLYLTFNAVHAPLEAAPKYRERFPAIKDEKRQTFAAMLSALDDAVGGVLAKLRAANLEDDTLIIFVSDNGGPTRQTTSHNGVLNGVKGTVWEGGIRVPYIVQWKGRLPAGKVYGQPVIALDIHPTALAAAGVDVPAEAKLDGVNLVPALEGKNSQPPHAALYWRFGPQWAIRQGEWKLLKTGADAPKLFNLAADIAEKEDLYSKEPERRKELEAAYQQWNAQLLKPLWKRG